MEIRNNKEIYPVNLLNRILPDPVSEMLPDDIIPTIDYVCAVYLHEREEEVLKLYYRDHYTLSVIAESYHLTKERIRQIIGKAERRLKNPALAPMLTKGIREVQKEMKWAIVQADQETEKAKWKLQKWISEADDSNKMDVNTAPEESILFLDLSVRSYNGLTAAGIHTLYDLSRRSMSDLMSIRNLGRKSCQEINEHMVAAGYALRKETCI